MNRRSVMGVMVMAATLVSAQAVYAAPFAGHTPTNTRAAKSKLVKLTLRNDSAAPLKLKAGDDELTLLPGKPVDVSLAAGQQIVAEETTPKHPAGTVLATAIAGLDGATISLQ